MTTELCASCHDPLLVEVASDSDDDDNDQEMTGSETPSGTAKSQLTPQQVIDDVELNCGCHFHWECFLDSPTITQCPSCGRNISSLQPSSSSSSTEPQQQVLVTIRNEGGTQENYDILPSATEEAYLRTYPEERRGHAFLEFVREGDLDAVVCLLKEDKDRDQEEDDDDENEIDVLRYSGTFEGIEGTALHVAVRNQREEIAWLLLAMGSGLAWDEFPQGAVEVLSGFGMGKEDRRAEPDVRSIRDAEGRTPEDLAREVGGVWTKWVSSGKLRP